MTDQYESVHAVISVPYISLSENFTTRCSRLSHLSAGKLFKNWFLCREACWLFFFLLFHFIDVSCVMSVHRSR